MSRFHTRCNRKPAYVAAFPKDNGWSDPLKASPGFDHPYNGSRNNPHFLNIWSAAPPPPLLLILSHFMLAPLPPSCSCAASSPPPPSLAQSLPSSLHDALPGPPPSGLVSSTNLLFAFDDCMSNTSLIFSRVHPGVSSAVDFSLRHTGSKYNQISSICSR